MSTRDSTGHARVCGNDIVFQGRRVSPRGLTLAIAGDGRNAWRDLWLRMPGEIDFKQASRCRNEHERMAAGLPVHPYAPCNARWAPHPHYPAADDPGASAPASWPAEHHARHALDAHPESTAVAAAVAEALKAMLVLMERLNAGTPSGPTSEGERRIHRGRREEDVLADHCALD